MSAGMENKQNDAFWLTCTQFIELCDQQRGIIAYEHGFAALTPEELRLRYAADIALGTSSSRFRNSIPNVQEHLGRDQTRSKLAG